MPPAVTLLPQYPETDLVEYYRDHENATALPYLSPIPDIPPFNYNDNFKRVALQHAQRHGFNPIQFEIGHNPLSVDADDIEASIALIPHPKLVPSLQELPHPTTINALQHINKHDHAVLCTANVVSTWSNVSVSASDVVLLKIFRETSSIQKGTTSSESQKHGSARSLFEREKAAYERLIHHGVVAAGVVPACYGWFSLTTAIDGISDSPTLRNILSESRGDDGPPRVLVLEYIHNAERVSIHNASSNVAHGALAGLQLVHRAFVLHRDVTERNVIVKKKPGSTARWPCYHVYIVNFDSAVIADGSDEPRNPLTANRATLMSELGTMWELFFRYLIPNGIIGWDAEMPL